MRRINLFVNNAFLAFALFSFTLLFLMCGSAHAVSEAVSENSFQDTLSVPAMRMDGALKLENQPIMAVTVVKGKIIGVGLRGLIVLSDDGGHTWHQAQVPVQSDLTAVAFPTAHRGWAVGHDGVILATSDGGETWVKQLDGKMVIQPMVAYYQKLVDAGDVNMQRYLDQIRLNYRIPASLPYLGVFFENEQVGYVVGSFGSIMMTQDGGKTWEPWLHRTDNEKFLTMNDIRQIGSALYAIGERGAIWKLDKTKQRFSLLSTGYSGTFFGIAGYENTVLAVGIGGTIYRSIDGGAKWQEIKNATVTTNLTTAATYNLGSNSLHPFPLIATQDGDILVGDAAWQTFLPMPGGHHLQSTSSIAVDEATGRIILVGYGGIRVLTMKSTPSAIKE